MVFLLLPSPSLVMAGVNPKPAGRLNAIPMRTGLKNGRDCMITFALYTGRLFRLPRIDTAAFLSMV
jgi:hypothetical protein